MWDGWVDFGIAAVIGIGVAILIAVVAMIALAVIARRRRWAGGPQPPIPRAVPDAAARGRALGRRPGSVPR
ncbi:uncharacterized protein (TIGR03382 family) [Microbacterium sp. SORGH_AS 505]|uniref:MYXO-CTERM sorting domain-containing protein n=1 Tax=Microbacterium sp. SORGH_AS_0505 TaxID=3041770 RepID=UPI0027829241|nr:MYXO-CTERM sorting domain-containing protein [Microbacterium sp. SORGH_AS_0505]MDQ1126575.1 uncharacterized protein (TIGR03382 family) [Microbacterium sp. SORGH_AS_0505]